MVKGHRHSRLPTPTTQRRQTNKTIHFLCARPKESHCVQSSARRHCVMSAVALLLSAAFNTMCECALCRFVDFVCTERVHSTFSSCNPDWIESSRGSKKRRNESRLGLQLNVSTLNANSIMRSSSFQTQNVDSWLRPGDGMSTMTAFNNISLHWSTSNEVLFMTIYGRIHSHHRQDSCTVHKAYIRIVHNSNHEIDRRLWKISQSTVDK